MAPRPLSRSAARQARVISHTPRTFTFITWSHLSRSMSSMPLPPESVTAALFTSPSSPPSACTACCAQQAVQALGGLDGLEQRDRKSTRLNSSHSQISYAVFCLKKKKKDKP